MIRLIGVLAATLHYVTISSGSLVSYFGAFDNHPALASLLETVDMHTVQLTSSGRRRTVRDLDCDNYQADSDEIENRCSQYRIEILGQQDPRMTLVLQSNASVTDSLNALDTSFNGDPIRPMEVRGILKTLLNQRVILYGGIDPATDVSEPGLLKRFDSALKSTKWLSDRRVASLDTLWADMVLTDKSVAYQLYDRVFVFARKVDEVLMMMQTAGQGMLTANLASIRTAMSQLQVLLAQVASEICNVQKKLALEGKKTSDAANKNVADLTPVIDAVLNLSEQVMEQMDQRQHEAADVVDTVVSRGEALMSGGVDSVEMTSNAFMQTFSDALDAMLNTFANTTDRANQASFDETDVLVTNGTRELLDDIRSNQNSVDDMKLAIDDKISSLRDALYVQVNLAASRQTARMGSAEDLLLSSKNNVSDSVASLSQSQKRFNMQVDDELGRVGTVANNVGGQVARAVDSGSEAAGSALAGAAASVQGTREQVQSLIGSSKDSVNVDLDNASAGIDSANLSAGNAVTADASAIDKAQQLAQARANLAADASGNAVRGALGPLLASVGATGSETATVGSQMAADRAKTVAETKEAMTANKAAVQAHLAAAAASGLLSISNGTATLAYAMASASQPLETTQALLSSAVQSLSSQQRAAGTLGQDAADASHHAQDALGTIAGDLGNWDDQLVHAFGDSVGSAVKGAQGGLATAKSAVADRLAKARADIQEPLFSLISQLKTQVAASGNPSADPDTRALLELLSSIQEDMASITAKERAMVAQFESVLTQQALKAHSALPTFFASQTQMIDSLRKGVPQKLTLLLTPAYDQLASKIDQLRTQFDPSLPDKAKEQLAGIQQRIVSIGAEFTKAVQERTNVVSEMDTSVAKFNNEVADRMQALRLELGRVSADSLDHVKESAAAMLESLRMTPAQIAAQLAATSQFSIAEINSAVDSRVDSVLAGDKADVAAAATVVRGDSQLTGDAFEKVLTDAAEAIASKADGSLSDLKSQGSEVDATSAAVNQAIAFARAVSQEINRYELQTTQRMNNVLATAQQLADKIDWSIGWNGRSLERDIQRSGNQMEFAVTGDGSEASKIATSSDGATATALDAVAQFRDTVDWMLNTAGADAAAVQHNVSAFGAQLEDLFQAADEAESHQQVALNSSMSLEQKVTQFQLHKVRDFVSAVRNSWLAYVDNQTAKFEKMSEVDRANLASYARIADSALTSGREKLKASQTSVATAEDAFRGEQQKFSAFDTELQSNGALALTGLETLSNETDSEVSRLGAVMTELRSNMTSTDTADRAEVGGRLVNFESALADIESRVLDSLV